MRPRGPVTEAAAVGAADQEIRRLLAEWGIPTGEDMTLSERLRTVTIEQLIQLVETVPVDPDEARWNTAGVVAVLQAVWERYEGEGFIYVRPTGTKRGVSGLPSGAITGPEQQLATTKPMLALVFRDDALPDVPPFWFPTLVLPPDVPPILFNMLGN